MEEIIQAAKSANAHDFISGMPQSYDTQVGERTRSISSSNYDSVSAADVAIDQVQLHLE